MVPKSNVVYDITYNNVYDIAYDNVSDAVSNVISDVVPNVRIFNRACIFRTVKAGTINFSQIFSASKKEKNDTQLTKKQMIFSLK